MSRRKYDAVFIDYYGTLADGDRVAVETTCARIVEDHRLPVTAAELSVIWGKRFYNEIEVANRHRFLNLHDCEAKTLVETVRKWAKDIDPSPYCRMLKEYWASAPAHDDAHAALAAIDVPVCCVSNADADDLSASVARNGLALDFVITSEEVRSYKPDAAIFEAALRLMDIDPERVVHVGDSLHSDVAGAANLGITTIWLCRDNRIFDIGECTPDHKIISLNELKDFLC